MHAVLYLLEMYSICCMEALVLVSCAWERHRAGRAEPACDSLVLHGGIIVHGNSRAVGRLLDTLLEEV
jgi:hypothetical protein